MQRRNQLIALTSAVVALAAAAGIVAIALTRGGTHASTTAGSAAAAGQVIYQAGRNPNGNPIPRTSSGGGGMMGGGMMGGGCANCHGSDGHGRSTMTFTAPNITYANLTDPKGMLQPDGTRGPTYTDTSLHRAITQGIDPKGDQLASPMPQWQLTGGEWTALLAYLKTLK